MCLLKERRDCTYQGQDCLGEPHRSSGPTEGTQGLLRLIRVSRALADNHGEISGTGGSTSVRNLKKDNLNIRARDWKMEEVRERDHKGSDTAVCQGLRNPMAVTGPGDQKAGLGEAG